MVHGKTVTWFAGLHSRNGAFLHCTDYGLALWPALVNGTVVNRGLRSICILAISHTELKTALWEHPEAMGTQETMQQWGAPIHIAVPANVPEGAWLGRFNLGHTEGWQADYGPNWTDLWANWLLPEYTKLWGGLFHSKCTVCEREKSMKWIVLIF